MHATLRRRTDSSPYETKCGAAWHAGTPSMAGGTIPRCNGTRAADPRITASGFATSLVTTYWDRRERLHQSRLVESLSVFHPKLRQAIGSIKDLGFSDHSAVANVLHEVVNQGLLLSNLDLFYFSGCATLILIAACWLVRRPSAGAAVAGGE
jgi:MFS transporter, DHA2 family, multidrug resistance protein